MKHVPWVPPGPSPTSGAARRRQREAERKAAAANNPAETPSIAERQRETTGA